jgi:hydrogenase-4 component E
MPAHLGFGAFGYDLAHLLGAGVLVLSFMLLYQRRVSAVIDTYAAQALALAAAAAWQGWVQAAPQLYLTAAITLGAKGFLLPLALRRMVRRLAIHRAVETALGIFPSMVLGVALVALAILVVLPTTLAAQALTREDLALALSVVLLGVLMMITRRNALTQTIGFLSLENGLILAAVGVAGLPLVVELSVAVLVLVAFTLSGIFFFRIRERFDSLDASHLDRVGEVRR